VADDVTGDDQAKKKPDSIKAAPTGRLVRVALPDIRITKAPLPKPKATEAALPKHKFAELRRDERIERFDKLATLDIDTKERLHGLVAMHAQRLVGIEASLDITQKFLGPMTLLVAFLMLFPGPFIAQARLNFSTTPVPGLGDAPLWQFFLFYLVAVVAILEIPVPFLIFAKAIRSPRLASVVTVAYYTACGTGLFAIATGFVLLPRNGIPGVVTFFLTSSLLGAFLIFVSLLPNIICLNAFARLASRRYPDSTLFDQLLSLLSRIEASPELWSDLDFKKKSIADLEAVAHLVQRDLLRELLSGEVATDRSVRDWVRQIAAGLRSLKLWILAPYPDTRDQLMKRLAETLVHVASGDWGAVEGAFAAESARSRISQAIVLLGNVATGWLPLGLFLLLQGVVHFDPGIANWIWTALLLWGVLSVLAVDPLFPMKIQAIGGFIGKVPGSGS
jgi:hypothetical protein